MLKTRRGGQQLTMVWLVAILTLFHTPLTIAEDSAEQVFSVAPPEQWVKPITPFQSAKASDNDDGDETQHHLIDYQINATIPGNSAEYRAFEYRVLTPNSVTDNSQISIDFDPSHSTLTVHEFTILREDELIDKLTTTTPQIVQRELELESLGFNGVKTVNFLPEDIQPGDVIRYSYTLRGDKTVFRGHREFYIAFDGPFAVDREYYRILSPSDAKLHARISNPAFEVKEKIENGVHEAVIDRHQVESVVIPDMTPSWRDNTTNAVFSSINDWSDIVDLYRPFYTVKTEPNPLLITVASSIRERADSEEAQFAEALRWVQDEIRYYAVSTGNSGFEPASIDETLSRRYGDCKAKAKLLIELLSALGFQSDAALVNTSGILRNQDQPSRLYAFDHVIVRIEHNGKSHWLDATDVDQVGDLGDFSEPDWGYALVLADGVNALESMTNQYSLFRESTINQLSLPSDLDSVANLTVVNHRVSVAAEWRRYAAITETSSEFTRRREDEMRYGFPGLKAIDHHVIDAGDNNHVTTTERYTIEGLWETNLVGGNRREITASTVQDVLTSPVDAWHRNTAYLLGSPFDIEERWEVVMDSKPQIEDPLRIVNTPWFEFRRVMSWNEVTRTLTVDFRVEQLVREVPAQDMRRYFRAVNRAWTLSSFELLLPELAIATVEEF